MGKENSDDDAGDMALVDFDRYVHGRAEISELGKGTAGYAAKEVWTRKVPQIGTDRTSMAILIQEFIVLGDPEICKEEALDWTYNQESSTFDLKSSDVDSEDIRSVRAHPLLAAKYSTLARLVEDTICATNPDTRPAPQSWRGPLRDIVDPPTSAAPQKLRELTLEEITEESPPYRLAFKTGMKMLNLSETRFRIHASLKRDSDGSIYLAVHDGARLSIKIPGSTNTVEYGKGARVLVQAGLILVGQDGSMSTRLLGPR